MTTADPKSIQPAKLVSLYRLVDELLCSYKKTKKDRRKFFINEVPRNLSVSTDKNLTDPYFADLFAIISADHGPTCVRISARHAENSIKLYTKKSEIKGFSFSGIRIHAA